MYQQGKYKEAIPLDEQLLALIRQLPGDEDAEAAESIGFLAFLYQSTGNYAKAEPLYQEALAISRKAPGPEELSLASILNNLGKLYLAIGEYAKAEPLYLEELAIFRKAGLKRPRHGAGPVQSGGALSGDGQPQSRTAVPGGAGDS